LALAEAALYLRDRSGKISNRARRVHAHRRDRTERQFAYAIMAQRHNVPSRARLTAVPIGTARYRSSHTCLTPWPIVGHVAWRFSPFAARRSAPVFCLDVGLRTRCGCRWPTPSRGRSEPIPVT